MVNLPDIAGTGAVVQFQAINATARWIQIIVSGTGTVRLGTPPTLSATEGLPMAAGSGMFFPWSGQLSCYNLAQFWAYIPAGTTVSVAYEPFN